MDDFDKYCPYLHYYTQAFIDFNDNFINKGIKAFDKLMILTSNVEYSNTYLESQLILTLYTLNKQKNEYSKLYSNIPNGNVGPLDEFIRACDIAKKIIIEDIGKKRQRINDELNFIISQSNEINDMTSIQKIYLLDYMRKQKGQKPYYTENSFSSQFVPNKKIPLDEVTIEEVKTIIKNKDIDIVNMYNINSIDDLIRFELLNVITNNVVIKKCKYCNQYFVPKGRSDSEYCDRISKGETRPCNVIGAVKLHEASKADDKVYQAYLKAYRRMNSRARQKKISQNQFYEWSEEARTKRDKCKKDEITFYEYKKWLDKDKKN